MEYDGLRLGVHPDVYHPSDDTFLLARAVASAVQPGMRVLEVGCGTGLVSLCAARAGARVCASDINPAAVRLARDNARANRLPLRVAVADLLLGWSDAFDLVAFNAPYLPTADDEHVDGMLDLAFDGGPDGNRVVLRFVEQLTAWAHRPAIYIVHSSLADPAPLVSRMEALGYTARVAAEEDHFMERIIVRAFSP